MRLEFPYPTYAELLEFTNGEWDSIPYEIRPKIEEACKLKLKETAHHRAWEDLCPPEYRNTSSERLPNVEKFEQVQKWQYGAKGLLVLGPTRRGKTRSVWTLLKRLHFDERRSIIAFSPMDLKLQVAKAWRDPEEAESWVDRLRTVQVLFFDDLDTVKFTEAVEETIYDAFEFRPTHRRPVIATVNRTGRELAARMNANGRGAKIVERMREYCQVVNFT
jgi:DNA replication protein DnaC